VNFTFKTTITPMLFCVSRQPLTSKVRCGKGEG